MSDTTSDQTFLLEILRDVADGLLFPSETDAPLEPFFCPDEQGSTLTPERLREVADIPKDVRIKAVKLETFFRPATEEREWHNEEERAEARRFQTLVATIESTLHQPKVFRVGEVNIDVYVVGHVEGGWAGLKTKVVET